ncbi:hypothetical protein BJF83_17260 [Nocardiopsis sp. CNR-923]|uniref:hypothetical protein n=1 Tax=Nocardiopsis sp. CNR-923 TaxID=1904965 RepID=UPI0009646AA2|nr:hypothetical protein [Nocardiopsis sp. CNR-923]OLT27735.1 hypothetical protein BJF83_17260 [Nocardiopsis sp. CNR-923]
MAQHGIVPGKRYHLLHRTRGVGTEVDKNWDWLRISNQTNDPWETVIFHEYEGGRYVIEATEYHWDDYKYWQMTRPVSASTSGTPPLPGRSPRASTDWPWGVITRSG